MVGHRCKRIEEDDDEDRGGDGDGIVLKSRHAGFTSMSLMVRCS